MTNHNVPAVIMVHVRHQDIVFAALDGMDLFATNRFVLRHVFMEFVVNQISVIVSLDTVENHVTNQFAIRHVDQRENVSYRTFVSVKMDG